MPLLWKRRSRKAIDTKVNKKIANGHVTNEDIPNGGTKIQPYETIVINGCGNNSQITTSNDNHHYRNTTTDVVVTVVVVTQNFAGTITDELTVTRGQVVQSIYPEGDWLYVMNIDGNRGYIPVTITSSIDHVKSNSFWNSSNIRQVPPKPKLTAADISPKPPQIDPLSVIYSTVNKPSPSAAPSQPPSLPSHNSDSFSSSSQSQSTTNKPSESSATVDVTFVSLSKNTPKLHPLHPLSLTRILSNERCSSKYDADSVPPSTPAAHPLSVHLRNESYQEAVVCEEPKINGISHHPRPSNLPLLCSNTYSDVYQHETVTYTRTGTQESHLDDVFLPTVNKPMGIYKAVKSYERTVQGEVSLHVNEYLIVTEIGAGDWAWVITAAGAEGVVPKSNLIRYWSIDNEVISQETQTELIVSEPCTVINIPPASRTPRQENRAASRQMCSRRTVDTGIQTDYVSPLVMDAAWLSSSQTVDDLWYENSMSIPQLDRFCDSPSICTLPRANGQNHDYGITPLAFHASRQSLPHFPVTTYSFTLTKPKGSLRSGWPPNYVLPNDNHVENSSQVIILKATRSYLPEPQGSGYLTLARGDILHVHPGKNSVNNKGWIWVYHLRKNMSGFVPKSHTACMLTNTIQRGINRYDEV
jgi:hypothetical protein